MKTGDDVFTDEGRGAIINVHGGPPVDYDSTLTIRLLTGRVICRRHHLLPEDAVKNRVVRIVDPPTDHPYRSSLTKSS